MITATPIDTKCWQFVMARDTAKTDGRKLFVYNWATYNTKTGKLEHNWRKDGK